MGRFHAGEQALQARLHPALPARMQQTAAMVIREFMPDQHREFFALLPSLIIGSLDDAGRPWASMLSGLPGFILSPDPQTLHVAAKPIAGDPLGRHLTLDTQLGLLGLQPETRRRNRMNGRVTALDGSGFTVTVEQSFGNCPQYIQARAPRLVAAPAAPPLRPESASLSPRAGAMLSQADTVFIATAAKDEGVDASHRGGRPGFLRVEQRDGATQLTLPDFRGNKFFNTLGNIALNPRAGLLVVDYATGDLLQLTAHAEIIWDGPEVDSFAGAERLLRLNVETGHIIEGGLPLRWSEPDYAPQLIATGSWT
ncbi:pyridoxamine 5'-phosphate oxidase family protein [Ferrovibrio sp.]|uniref:pyridoxamine 5'-phosphate oxidase family protein n=1 Tax=Ferrovibrio sp. TaxID=1917215 RepID=UPI00261F3E1D|nr:pyridoxamine 5'-phosphate oxidase family protein [Ferrovibrio sp.]